MSKKKSLAERNLGRANVFSAVEAKAVGRSLAALYDDFAEKGVRMLLWQSVWLAAQCFAGIHPTRVRLARCYGSRPCVGTRLVPDGFPQLFSEVVPRSYHGVLVPETLVQNTAKLNGVGMCKGGLLALPEWYDPNDELPTYSAYASWGNLPTLAQLENNCCRDNRGTVVSAFFGSAECGSGYTALFARFNSRGSEWKDSGLLVNMFGKQDQPMSCRLFNKSDLRKTVAENPLCAVPLTEEDVAFEAVASEAVRGMPISVGANSWLAKWSDGTWEFYGGREQAPDADEHGLQMQSAGHCLGVKSLLGEWLFFDNPDLDITEEEAGHACDVADAIPDFDQEHEIVLPPPDDWQGFSQENAMSDVLAPSELSDLEQAAQSLTTLIPAYVESMAKLSKVVAAQRAENQKLLSQWNLANSENRDMRRLLDKFTLLQESNHEALAETTTVVNELVGVRDDLEQKLAEANVRVFAAASEVADLKKRLEFVENAAGARSWNAVELVRHEMLMKESAATIQDLQNIRLGLEESLETARAERDSLATKLNSAQSEIEAGRLELAELRQRAVAPESALVVRLKQELAEAKIALKGTEARQDRVASALPLNRFVADTADELGYSIDELYEYLQDIGFISKVPMKHCNNKVKPVEGWAKDDLESTGSPVARAAE